MSARGEGGSWEKLAHAGFRVSEARRLLYLSEDSDHRGLLPQRYITLAIAAFEQGEITEGQFARFLRVDQSEARRIRR